VITSPPEPASTTKAARTRGAIIDAALRLFREHGYDATTMRAIAAEAGVSVGNAYYYFESKEQLVQGFYDRAQDDHANAARHVLDTESDLTVRIVGVTDAWIETMEPYRAFAGQFFKNAAEPTSPLSPFSSESTQARRTAIELWRDVIDGSDAKIPARLRGELPELLWLYFMGMVLIWVHDRTPDASTVRAIVRSSAPIVGRAISLTRLPVARGMMNDILAMMGELKQLFASEAESELARD
jgi:AcrR family transcriptional regulator